MKTEKVSLCKPNRPFFGRFFRTTRAKRRGGENQGRKMIVGRADTRSGALCVRSLGCARDDRSKTMSFRPSEASGEISVPTTPPLWGLAPPNHLSLHRGGVRLITGRFLPFPSQKNLPSQGGKASDETVMPGVTAPPRWAAGPGRGLDRGRTRRFRQTAAGRPARRTIWRSW